MTVATVQEFLGQKRVSELQEIHDFWSGGGKAPGRKGELLDELTGMLRDSSRVHQRLKLLSERPLLVLQLLVRADGFAADLPGLVRASGDARVEGYEVEAAARALVRRGFLEIVRDRKWNGGGREIYAMPRELAETIAVLLMEDRRGPRQVFTLAGHLAHLPAGERKALCRRVGIEPGPADEEPAALVERLLVDTTVESLLARVKDGEVVDLLRGVGLERGGILPRLRFKEVLGEPLRWQRKRWQRYLEEAGIGTATTLGLDDCGIAMEGETTVIFAEIVERMLDAESADEATFDRVVTARVDLLTDLSHFLRQVAAQPVRVTHRGTIHRAAHARILDGMTFREDAIVDRPAVFEMVHGLARGLELVEANDDRQLQLTRRGRAWDGVPLLRKVRRMLEQFLEERREDHRDFHDRDLRRRLLERLAATPTGEWIPARHLPLLARNEALASLEDRGVQAAYRNRFRREFEPPVETPEEMVGGVVEWIVQRLYPLGIVDLGLEAGAPRALRVTDQGRRLLRGEGEGAADADAGDADAPVRTAPVIVNPDFEILLLPEGDVNEVAHTLDRFARRVRSDEVARYRLVRESVERAVVQGFGIEAILEFLGERSRTPLPQNVVYSIREWGGRVRFARQREVVLLEVDEEDALDRALTLDAVRRRLLARISPTAAALRSRISDRETLAALRDLGIHLKP